MHNKIVVRCHSISLFFLIDTTSQSSGKLVWSSQLPLLPTCFGEWHGVRGHLLSVLQPMHPYRGREALKNCKPLPLDIGVGVGGSTPGTSLPQAMQGLGRWNGQSRQAPACPTPKHRAALPVDTRDLFSNWGKGQDLGGATQPPPAFFCRGS